MSREPLDSAKRTKRIAAFLVGTQRSRFTAMRILSHLSFSQIDPAAKELRHPGTAIAKAPWTWLPKLPYRSAMTLPVQVIPGCILVPTRQIKIPR